MTINISVHGDSHLADTMRVAARLRGFRVDPNGEVFDLTLAAQDVEDHASLDEAREVFTSAAKTAWRVRTPLVLVSQVPPGTTRLWAEGRGDVYYQVDTIIMKCAVARVYAPHRIIVGAADPDAPLPLAYQAYLAAHECPVLVMSYESAELAKCAINYVLAAQMEAARELEVAARRVGADYKDVERALRSDVRIGALAYLRPGHPNEHLSRDMRTIDQIVKSACAG